MISGDKSKTIIPKEKTNLEKFHECISPRIPIRYYIQSIGSSSSSVVAPGAEAVEVRKPRIVLSDIWSAFEEWSCFGLEVPLSLGGINSKVTQHYAPSLSAIQIFTIKPFLGDAASSRSLLIGKDGAESSSAKADSFSNSKPGFVRPDYFGNLYFEYNERKMPFQRGTLTHKIGELAEQYTGLNSLTSSDLSRYSWFSVAWYPIYPIPPVKTEKKGLSAAFLTYHSFTPSFSDGKKNAQEVSSVELSVFAEVTYKAHADVWIKPKTLDDQLMKRRREFALSWLLTVGFDHADFNFFVSRGSF